MIMVALVTINMLWMVMMGEITIIIIIIMMIILMVGGVCCDRGKIGSQLCNLIMRRCPPTTYYWG